MSGHVCTCGDCSPVPFEDRCQFEARAVLARAVLAEAKVEDSIASLESQAVVDAAPPPTGEEERGSEFLWNRALTAEARVRDLEGRMQAVVDAARSALIVQGMTPSKLPSHWQALSDVLQEEG